jgi:hypothetical protein
MAVDLPAHPSTTDREASSETQVRCPQGVGCIAFEPHGWLGIRVRVAPRRGATLTRFESVEASIPKQLQGWHDPSVWWVGGANLLRPLVDDFQGGTP